MMFFPSSSGLACGVALALASVPGLAQPGAASPEPAPVNLSFTPDWVVRFEPAVGYFAPSGDLRLPSSQGLASTEVELENDLNIDSPRLGPYIEATAARGRWRLVVSGLGFSIDRGRDAGFSGRLGDTAVAVGDRIDTEFTYATFGARAGYRFWDWVSGVDEEGRPDLSIGVDALVGFRGHDVDIDSRVTRAIALPGAATSASAEETFAEPVGGLAFELDYQRTFGMDLYVAAGGFSTGDRTSTSFDLGLGFAYRPRPWIGALVGYRLIVLNLEDGDGADGFEWEGAVAGLYWGVQLSF